MEVLIREEANRHVRLGEGCRRAASKRAKSSGFVWLDGFRSRESAIDVLDAKAAGMRGEKDTVLLDLAARQDRILITHDRNTMTRFFMERVASGCFSYGQLHKQKSGGIQIVYPPFW